MKKLTFLMVCSLMAATPSLAQLKKSPVTFDSYEWDFGAINASKGAVCHTFTLQNTSKMPVQIGKSIPSCDCIKAFYTTEEIQPGEVVKVMVAMSPSGASGKTYRSVELVDNNGQTLGSLTTKAMVDTAPADDPKYPFQNPKLSNEERVENLISLLTPEEKVGLMMNKSISVDRLGIPSYNWWSEACHGVRQGGYTVYPQPIGMAAAFNAQLVYDVFSTVSDEARANWNRTNHNDPNLFNVPMGVT
ncbi:MAG: DUF1573 domain-containing protein, partial [Bacteroidaceae bacterium]|nr:DUF1573 domain-containing protein [Bacteroidaceae bacterium]